MIKTLQVLTAIVVVLIGSLDCQATTADSLVYSLYFRQGDDLLLKKYRGNEQTIDKMSKIMTSENIARISSIKIIGSTSPEGNFEFNNNLAYKRAKSVRSYMIWRWNLKNQSILYATKHANPLSTWIKAVEQDVNVPRREKVLEILNSNASIQTKWANIQLLAGNASKYMEQKIFPPLRNGVACIITFVDDKAAIKTETITKIRIATKTEPVTKTETPTKTEIVEAVVLDDAATEAIVAPDTVTQEEQVVIAIDNAQIAPQTIAKPNKPLFALKTNLLFDVATILNLEIEVPIGKRWSVVGELILPWWLSDNKQNCLQVMSGTFEGRYWFGNRNKRNLMTGWFAGVHSGGGYYDLEWNKKGYQGEFYIAAGVSGGYAHTINKSGTLRMEYSIGVGYLSTKYRQYEAKFSDADNSWHLYRQQSGQFSWFGPTRAKISLIWMIDTNLFKKKGGYK